jgi:hypothetical protein
MRTAYDSNIVVLPQHYSELVQSQCLGKARLLRLKSAFLGCELSYVYKAAAPKVRRRGPNRIFVAILIAKLKALETGDTVAK